MQAPMLVAGGSANERGGVWWGGGRGWAYLLKFRMHIPYDTVMHFSLCPKKCSAGLTEACSGTFAAAWLGNQKWRQPSCHQQESG